MTTTHTDPLDWRRGVQITLFLAVAAGAACGSWSHVLQLARDHGQEGWRAWVVAACIETAALSAGLELDRRRRSHEPIHWIITLLVVSAVLQLAAQLAEAEQSIWGWILAAVPAMTFLTLAKIALTRAHHAPSPRADESDRPAPIPLAVVPNPTDHAAAWSALMDEAPALPDYVEVPPAPTHPRKLPPVFPVRPFIPAVVSPTTVSAAAAKREELTARLPKPAERSLDALQKAVTAAIAAGDLKDRPSAEAIRKHVHCKPETARALREHFRQN